MVTNETIQKTADHDDGPVPIGIYPTLRIWNLTSDSSRYDRMRAAPSDEQMVHMWTGWAVVTFIVVTFTFTVLLGTLLNKKARNSPFNQYLIGLFIPDVIYSLICGIQCVVNAFAGHFPNPQDCSFQSFYNVWAIASSSWLNGMIAYEVHVLLKANAKRQKYDVPTRKRVITASCCCYLWAAFVASWGVMDFDWLPHKSNAVNGLGCVPFEYNLASALFFWFLFFPSLVLIPLVYGIYVAYDVVYGSVLLPPDGKKREIAVFFFRIVVVFVVMWLPTIIGVFVAGGINVWVFYLSGVWAHLQGAVSAAVSLGKSDIYTSVVALVRCKVREVNQQQQEEIMNKRGSARSRNTIVTNSSSKASSGNVHISGLSSFSMMNESCPLSRESALDYPNQTTGTEEPAKNEAFRTNIKDGYQTNKDDDDKNTSDNCLHSSSLEMGLSDITQKQQIAISDKENLLLRPEGVAEDHTDHKIT